MNYGLGSLDLKELGVGLDGCWMHEAGVLNAVHLERREENVIITGLVVN